MTLRLDNLTKMEDLNSSDLYFSWPDLVDDPYPEEVYLSWRDLVGKPDPEEIYFSWEDIMGKLYSKQDSHLRAPLQVTPMSFEISSYKSSANSDAGDSGWGDTESSLSLGFSNTPDLCSTNMLNWERGRFTPQCALLDAQCPLLIPGIDALPLRPHSSLGFTEATPVHRQLEKYSSDDMSLRDVRRLYQDISMIKQPTVKVSGLESGIRGSFPFQKNLNNDSSCNENQDVIKDNSLEPDKSLTRGSFDVVVLDTLDPMRTVLVDQVMEEFWVIFNQKWSANFTQHAGDSSTASHSSNAGDTYYNHQPLQRKRRRDEEDSDNQSDRGSSKQPGKKSSKGKESEQNIKLACPFRKHNPRKYNIYSHRTCTLSHWDSIARLKEHLYRCHPYEIHCTRCWQTFKTQQQLDAHIRVASADICSLIAGKAPDGITPDQEKRLRSRKKSHPGQSDESRWTDIYKLLFPNEEVPSPYFECLHDEPPLSPDSRDLTNYEDYIRRELPRIVRSEIEDAVRREMQPFRDSLIGNLVDIIQDCQDRVFRSYREGLDVEEDISLPPSIKAVNLESTSQPQEESGFLDAVFAHPPPAENTEAFLTPFDMRNESLFFSTEDHVFSDSGYASELLCNCPNLCSCFATTISSSSDWCVTQAGNESEELFSQHIGREDFNSYTNIESER